LTQVLDAHSLRLPFATFSKWMCMQLHVCTSPLHYHSNGVEKTLILGQGQDDQWIIAITHRARTGGMFGCV
jgi:hypothetical protein